MPQTLPRLLYIYTYIKKNRKRGKKRKPTSVNSEVTSLLHDPADCRASVAANKLEGGVQLLPASLYAMGNFSRKRPRLKLGPSKSPGGIPFAPLSS